MQEFIKEMKTNELMNERKKTKSKMEYENMTLKK